MTTTTVHVNAVGAVMGGAARHLGVFVRTLTELRPDWSIVVHVSAGATHDIPPGVEVHAVAGGYARRMAWDGYLVSRAAARGGATALVNLTNYGPFRCPVPTVLFQRNPVYFDPSWVRGLDRRGRLDAAARRRLAFAQMRAATVVVTPSHAMADFLRSWRGFPQGTRVDVIPHAVDAERFTPAPAERDPPTGTVRILSVSHGAPHKGQLLLVDLVAELGRRGVDAEVRATIDRSDAPAYVDRLIERARQLGVTERVHLLGRTSSVERLFRACDVFVFPSLTESFGFPVVEAMASGVPIVASAIPATVELLADAGWYFQPGDVGGAANQVVGCRSGPAADRAAKIQHARALATGLNWERNVSTVAALVEEITASGRGRLRS